MQDSTEQVSVSAFDAARLKALSVYSFLEMTLADLLSHILGIARAKGHVIFFRITNTRSRYAIISDLLKQSSHSATAPFWKSVEKAILPIDQQRNSLVH